MIEQIEQRTNHSNTLYQIKQLNLIVLFNQRFKQDKVIEEDSHNKDIQNNS